MQRNARIQYLRCMSHPVTCHRPVNAVFGSQIVLQDTSLRQENVISYDTRFPPMACWFRAEYGRSEPVAETKDNYFYM